MSWLRYSQEELDLLPFSPLTSSFLPIPGEDFIAEAMNLGDEAPKIDKKDKPMKLLKSGPVLEKLYREALYQPDFRLNVLLKGQPIQATFVPGHIWGSNGHPGPRPAEIMVVGKWPGREELQQCRNFVGPSGDIFRRALEECGVDDTDYWYVTNVVKHANVDPASIRLPKKWIVNCLPILWQEINIVRPKFILCLGNEASEAVLGSVGGVTTTQGRVFEQSVTYFNPDGSTEESGYKVMTCIHPAVVARSVDQYPSLLSGVQQFVDAINGSEVEDRKLKLEKIYTRRHLDRVVDDILSDPEGNCIALDSEWHGEYPTEPGAWLRMIQFSHKPGHAYIVVLRHQGGKTAFCPGIDAAREPLRRLLMAEHNNKVRIIGHNLRADLPWINSFDPVLGEALMNQFTAPDHDEDPDGRERLFGWQKTRTAGGFDTMLAVHSVQEVAGPSGYKLEVLCNQYCGIPRWDRDLILWKKDYCSERKIKEKDLEGYGDCPDDILMGDDGEVNHKSYAGWDAAGTRELFELLNKPGGLLDSDMYGNDARKAFWVAMRASPAFLEMEMTGVYFDKEKSSELAVSYAKVEDKLLTKLRREINWPNFNPNSTPQCRELLFGYKHNGKRDKETNAYVKLSKPDAVNLCLQPIVSSGKPSKDWEQIRRRGEEHLFSPSTSKEVLGIFLANMPTETEQQQKARRIVELLRNIRFVRAVLSKVVCPPKVRDHNDDNFEPETDDNGEEEFEKGLVTWLHSDNRIRTHLFQTAETGRAKSARPPVQNLSADGDTEILTRRGFIKLKDLTERDEVAQYWTTNRTVDFVKPELQVQRYRGNMQHILGNDQIDLFVTSNHRCLLRSRKTYKALIVNAEDINPRSGDFRWVHAGIYGGGVVSLSEDEVKWLCAVQADGSYVSGGGIVFSFSKERKIESLTGVLGRLGAKFRTSERGTGVTSVYVGANDPWAVWAKKRMPDKKFGPWLLDFDRATLDLIAEEVLFWDGLWTRKTEYSSSDKENADWIQILWCLSGWRARMREYWNRNPKSSTHYCVDIPSLHRRRDYSQTKSLTKKEVPWDDLVYCVTVPSEFVIFRRNGKISVTGNSKRREADYKKILGDDYQYPLRSMLCASPGWVGVEADYIGAELAVMALQSGSAAMVDHCMRAELDDKDPRKYDIHSTVTVQAFRLTIENEKVLAEGAKVLGKDPKDLGLSVGDPLPPLKFWLKAAGKAKLRDVAKCVVAGSRLLTSRGWVRVEELCGHLDADTQERFDGDLTLVTDEGPTPLKGLYRGPASPCIRVTTADGHSVTGTVEHRFRSVDDKGRLVWVRSADIRVGDWAIVYDGYAVDVDSGRDNEDPPFKLWPAADSYRSNLSPIEVPEHFTEDWAAFLGLHVSEGCLLKGKTSSTFSVSLAEEKDPSFAEASEALLRRLFGHRLKVATRFLPGCQRQRSFLVASNQLCDWLRIICPGLSADRIVPDFVFQWPNRLVRTFLRWLFEGDGTAKRNGNGFLIQYSSSSSALARDVQILLDGLGIASRLRSERRKDCDGVYWTVTVSRRSQARFLSDVGFVTASKRDRCATATGYSADVSVYPNQLDHLKTVFPYLQGRAREKCRECLRTNSRVRLNRSRLAEIVAALPADLPTTVVASAEHLRNLLALRGRFVRVSSVEDVGDHEVYDVESGNHHLVVNGLSNHNTLMFGLAYGRGDEAVMRAIEEEGITATPEQVGNIRSTIFHLYPELETFFGNCQQRVVDPGWLRNCYGRSRRFQPSTDQKVVAEMQRQAGNFPIQSAVADLVSRALDKFYWAPDRRDASGLKYRLILQIHDAIMFEVRPDCLEWFLGDPGNPGFLHRVMSGIPMYQCDLSGRRTPGRDPIYMPVEHGLYLNWGVPIDKQEGLKLGIPEKYLK